MRNDVLYVVVMVLLILILLFVLLRVAEVSI
jgi:hypothetical protein